MTKDECTSNCSRDLKTPDFGADFILSRRILIIFMKRTGYDPETRRGFHYKTGSSCIYSNDGKQTPMRGHPVFIAQHATATCCRECIRKWHKIQPGRELSQVQQEYLVDVIMTWIERGIGKRTIKGGFNYMKRKRISFLTMLMLAVILLMPASIFACA